MIKAKRRTTNQYAYLYTVLYGRCLAGISWLIHALQVSRQIICVIKYQSNHRIDRDSPIDIVIIVSVLTN